MSLGISYMGTKRHLVPSLTEVISSCREGIFLDAFSGMCSVGRAVAPRRQVWSNDLQAFAQLVATTHFCSSDIPISRHEAPSLTSALRSSKMQALLEESSSIIERERTALQNNDVETLGTIFDEAIDRAQYLESPSNDYDLFSRRYGGSYFGHEQAAEIDSIRFSLDRLKQDGRLSLDQWNALVVALCVALSKCSNSTGHFAQALYPKSENIKKVIAKRRRSIFIEWTNAIDGIHPLGSKDWRAGNHAFRSDALELLINLQEYQQKPSVVYADPPYTQDQYSRYYHIYETAVLYDYPNCSGRGLYRPNRSTSPFSLASKIEQALDQLIEAVARVKSCLVLSYPKDGLLRDSEHVISKMIRDHFGTDPDLMQISHHHSTMGASKGATKHDVTEVIYRVIR